MVESKFSLQDIFPNVLKNVNLEKRVPQSRAKTEPKNKDALLDFLGSNETLKSEVVNSRKNVKKREMSNTPKYVPKTKDLSQEKPEDIVKVIFDRAVELNRRRKAKAKMQRKEVPQEKPAIVSKPGVKGEERLDPALEQSLAAIVEADKKGEFISGEEPSMHTPTQPPTKVVAETNFSPKESVFKAPSQPSTRTAILASLKRVYG